MFQAYLIICVASGKQSIGITSRSIRQRWNEHLYNARKRPKANALFRAITKYGSHNFSMQAICCAKSWNNICQAETQLIAQYGTLAPNGYNLTLGGEGRFGYRPSRESVELSAAKHRGRPCHPNTRAAASAFHAGKPKSAEHRSRIAASKNGKPRSEATKEKLRAYWAAQRVKGDFKTDRPYAHARKAASALIAKIPFPFASYLARVYHPGAAGAR